MNSILSQKKLNLDIERLIRDDGQSYWRERVEEEKRKECRLDCGEIANLIHNSKNLLSILGDGL